MKIFVTGGTGLLGNAILRQLTHSEHESLALVRGEPDADVFEGIETEFVTGDLLDADVIGNAVAACDAVIHAAGLIHIGWKQMEESMRVNRDGTRVIVEACLNSGRKLVHVASTNTLALGTRQTPADENTPLDNAGGQVPCSYVLSKRAGVVEVQRGIERGLQAVILCPGFMLGPGDWKPSSGRMMVEMGRGWKMIAPAGGCSVCDARDVAEATIATLDLDLETGREFLLGGENLTYKHLWREMASRMGQRGPLFAAGPLQRWIGGFMGDAWSLLGKESDLNSASVRMTRQFHWYDSTRAREELGYRPRETTETLNDAAAWLQAHHCE
ncbi:MAG: NAD-dependent epimerase/dehydratase family protein [Rubripirellula sp.]